MRQPLALSSLRAFGWAAGTLRTARRELASGQLSAVSLPSPPDLPVQAGRGVDQLLRLRRHTCLEAALVRQRWLSAHGVNLDVVIGVRPADDFAAHAWLAGEEDPVISEFQELARLVP